MRYDITQYAVKLDPATNVRLIERADVLTRTSIQISGQEVNMVFLSLFVYNMMSFGHITGSLSLKMVPAYVNNSRAYSTSAETDQS
jgi:hypothetical protein